MVPEPSGVLGIFFVTGIGALVTKRKLARPADRSSRKGAG
ncbi:PEP-CTERM sorting domain-containing protein [Pannus brasiliensis CCIBt3594]|uniref:PEP-CTERM sorting domain-containing protein n=1 Tax=Pannus brasiliensis CCIBt3594 TaxID=1427578 RepID=A0AAW9R152_9CHRO